MFWIALAGLTPTGLMLAATVALACCAAPGAGRSRPLCAAVSLGAAVLGALPWLVAPLLAGSLSSTQAAGVPEFAARAEPGLGTLATLAGLGGMWNGQAVPSSRTTLFAVVATVVLLAVVVDRAAVGGATPGRASAAGAGRGRGGGARADGDGAGAGRGRGASPARYPGSACCATPRSGSRWRCPATRWPRGRPRSRCDAGCRSIVTAAVCCLALVAVLPDLAWGVGGKVTSVRYPAGWTAAAALIDADPRPVAVLPRMSMRHFPWAGDAPVLDPLPRWVSADVLTTGDLVIGGKTVPGEGQRAREVERLVLAGAGVDELAGAGVGWVVVEGAGPRLRLPLALADPDVTVYRVGGDRPAAPHRGLLIAAHLVWLATLLAGALGMAATAVTRRRARGAVY